MNSSNAVIHVTSNRPCGAFSRLVTTGVAALLAAGVACGCSSRTLIISKDPKINTANPLDIGLDCEKRKGESVEVAIVWVTPYDVQEKDCKLVPGSSTTAKEWFEGPEGFGVPPRQIFWLTDRPGVHGKVLHPALLGANVDGKTEVIVKGISFPGKQRRWTELYGKDSAIYVFAKFSGPDGQTLSVPPVVFNPPGAYSGTLRVHVGQRCPTDDQNTHGQYIENRSNRTFGRSATED